MLFKSHYLFTNRRNTENEYNFLKLISPKDFLNLLLYVDTDNF